MSIIRQEALAVDRSSGHQRRAHRFPWGHILVICNYLGPMVVAKKPHLRTNL